MSHLGSANGQLDRHSVACRLFIYISSPCLLSAYVFLVGLEYVSPKEEHILSAVDLLQQDQIIGTPRASSKLEQKH